MDPIHSCDSQRNSLSFTSTDRRTAPMVSQYERQVTIVKKPTQNDNAVFFELKDHIQEMGMNCVIADYSGKLGIRPDLMMVEWCYYYENREELENLFHNPFTGVAEVVPIVLYCETKMLNPMDLESAFDEGIEDVFCLGQSRSEIAIRIRKILEEKARIRVGLEKKVAEIKSLHLMIQKMLAKLTGLQKLLKNIQKQGPKIVELFPGIGSVVKEMQQALPQVHDWKMHQHRTEMYDPVFATVLKSRHPSLSSSDLKYCCLILLTLSRKETAEILNVTMDAIEKRRFRLRKKLNVEGRMSLENYVLELANSTRTGQAGPSNFPNENRKEAKR